jgi:hypothetical protein
MLANERLTPRAERILALAIAVALLFQIAIIAGASLRDSSYYDRLNSVLLSNHPHFSDVAAVVAMNSVWLAAITLLAWPIARLWSWDIHDTWDHPAVNAVMRVVYPSLAVVLLGALWWIFSEQALALSKGLVSRWALLVTLPHGTLEFTALFLPLSAAASCIVAPAAKPGRLLLTAFLVALPLLVCAALIEVYLSPELLAPLRT